MPELATKADLPAKDAIPLQWRLAAPCFFLDSPPSRRRYLRIGDILNFAVVNFDQPWPTRRCTVARGEPRRLKMDKRAEIDRFVRQHNIEHYRKLLGEPTDPLRRQQLQMLLAELETTQQ
jgi:hypothetical protein